MLESLVTATVTEGARAVSARRSSSKAKASNVILLALSEPRAGGGYLLKAEISNQNPVGISDVSVTVEMLGGVLELRGQTLSRDRLSAPRALTQFDTLTLPFPHHVRLSEESFETDNVDAGPSFRSTLFWRDDLDKCWKRVDGGRPFRVKGKELREFLD